MTSLKGGGVLTGIVTGAKGSGDGGDGAAATGVPPRVPLLGQEGGTTLGWGIIDVACTTPSMPWHLIEDPRVQILGLIILTLLRKNRLRPSFEILRTKPGIDVGIKEPVGKCRRCSIRRGEGIEWWSKKSTTLFSGIPVFARIRSLGIKKVMLPLTRSEGAIFMSITKVK
ncbi:Hypothetical predicted protein [Olea europaea subsp. europaea]|uniref:Uncharacterized protein n=1 Tax=Olea europaea subsp. europaea TaxID=158383 RepID=A0A8S0T4G6_OLEEU|nr:Hypothetical predicted protein [Olea europaea subsp. europaea]